MHFVVSLLTYAFLLQFYFLQGLRLRLIRLLPLRADAVRVRMLAQLLTALLRFAIESWVAHEHDGVARFSIEQHDEHDGVGRFSIEQRHSEFSRQHVCAKAALRGVRLN